LQLDWLWLLLFRAFAVPYRKFSLSQWQARKSRAAANQSEESPLPGRGKIK